MHVLLPSSNLLTGQVDILDELKLLENPETLKNCKRLPYRFYQNVREVIRGRGVEVFIQQDL